MTACRRFRALPVIVALVALSAVASLPMARAAPLPDGATASGGIVPQSPNCSAGREEDEGCVPRGPGSRTRPGGPVLPPVTPPVLPPGIPPEDLHKIIFGTAKATLHIKDDDQDVTYVSNEVHLVFYPVSIGQEVSGRTQYILIGSGGPSVPTVNWVVRGRVFDCSVEGQAIVTLQIGDPTDDPSLPAYGYMTVVGPDSGDFHSVMVKAFDPEARFTKTCPGNPPVVTKEPFGAGYLLHIPWQKNDRVGDTVIYKGHKDYDEGDPLDFLNLLPPGAAIPDEARQVLSQTSGSGTSRRYYWNWELKPIRQAN